MRRLTNSWYVWMLQWGKEKKTRLREKFSCCCCHSMFLSPKISLALPKCYYFFWLLAQLQKTWPHRKTDYNTVWHDGSGTWSEQWKTQWQHRSWWQGLNDNTVVSALRQFAREQQQLSFACHCRFGPRKALLKLSIHRNLVPTFLPFLCLFWTLNLDLLALFV